MELLNRGDEDHEQENHVDSRSSRNLFPDGQLIRRRSGKTESPGEEGRSAD